MRARGSRGDQRRLDDDALLRTIAVILVVAGLSLGAQAIFS